MEMDYRKVTSGIYLKLVTGVKCAKNNFGISRTLEAVMSFVNKFHTFSCFTLHIDIYKHN
jgi:hypothetical protein